MMSSSSSCFERYENFAMHHQQMPPINFYNRETTGQQHRIDSHGGYTSKWLEPPMKNVGDSYHNKMQNCRSNECDYNENSISRLAKHTQGAPIIMSGRCRNKPTNSLHQFGHDCKPIRNSSGLSKVPSNEADNYEGSGYHGNGTCLPRIIKPRKRRKKDRKPIVSPVENTLPENPFTFTSNQSNGIVQNVHANNIAFNNQFGKNFKRPATPVKNGIFFNCDFNLNEMEPFQSSTSSSPISLSNSSLSSSTNTSSCSCRLCDPNCKIWAFPLRRSFSDNSAMEIDYHGSSESATYIESSRKDVGVIGSNRMKTGEVSSKAELNFHKIAKNSAHADINRLRSESASDSSDSGCDLLLGGFNISDEILVSTLKTVGDQLTSERLNTITRQLSKCSIKAAIQHAAAVSSAMAKDNINHLDGNECAENLVRIQNMPNINTITKSFETCKFDDEHDCNLDVTSNIVDSYNYRHLMSPMLVNKQIYSLDLNNNHQASISDGSNLEERTLLFDCYNAAWQES